MRHAAPAAGDAALGLSDARPRGIAHNVRVTDPAADLVSALIAEQFPHWHRLPVTPVAQQGWDNRTFRLGEELSVRLPSGEGYVAGIQKEDRVLPFLAPRIPVSVPEPVATGHPGAGYPFPWSVRRWLPGQTADEGAELDRHRLARDLGNALAILWGLPTGDVGPAAGRHSYFRGCHPSVYSDQVGTALVILADEVDVDSCRRIWHDAITTVWSFPPVWFHGDVAPGNLLVRDGELSAIIDFGTCGIGDPACDLVMTWTYFDADQRQAFHTEVAMADDVWRRARGWALWKALATMSGQSSPDPDDAQRRVLTEVLADSVI